MDPPPPFEGEAQDDSLVLMLAGGGAVTAPVTPPTFQNHGNYITSLNRFTKWLAGVAEARGVQILPNFPGAEVLFTDGGAVKGVRTVDRGVGKHGERLSSFEPGTDITAKLTILGEGVRGHLSRGLIKKFKLDEGKNPQIYSTGVKELWKVKPGRFPLGKAVHTAGFPLSLTGNDFGGGFIYGFKDDHVSLGFVVSLDSPDPALDPHRMFSRWKEHPYVKAILEGGELVRYGAKAIPEGGWFSLPRPYMPGAMLVGDSAGFLNMTRLKGIHLAMKSGMLAAETAFEVLRDQAEATEERTKAYWGRILDSWVFEEMWKVRNFRQAFQKKPFGFLRGALAAGVHVESGGLWPPGKLGLQDDHHRIEKLREPSNGKQPPAQLLPTVDLAAKVAASRKDGSKTFAPKEQPAGMPEPSVKTGGIVYDKVTDVYYAGSTHEEDQPPHLVVADTDICHTRCAEEYGNPCQYFCPAAVYEMVEAEGGKGRQLRLNFSNCVHCKTCDIRDPYQIITWVTPQGGGPRYSGL
ncbi:MAG: electron transfer flavoprotein-ubiquinone oxidoreductase [Planctomycetota bacterium]|nr:electron transfer flavoprotein-ubiquinone oxidoreductase [Planctomycetota bacterium]